MPVPARPTDAFRLATGSSAPDEAGQERAEDHGVVELLLVLTRA
jgi:hypothetical protein